jgi:hypothetical protein
MTEQQFKDLKIGQKITEECNVYKVVNTYPVQRIIIATGVLEIEVPFRYEDVELALKDELVEYLNSMCIQYDSNTAKEIRSIVRKEVIDSLKFPSYDEWRSYGYDCFIEETKKLNR